MKYPSLTGIIKLLTLAAQKMKRPSLSLAVTSAGSGLLRVKPLKSNDPNHAGYLVVVDQTKASRTFGRIAPNGTWIGQSGMPWQTTDSVASALNELASNPQAAARRYGALTGNCCFCNRLLSDERSVSAGYGPDCAQHFALPWGEASHANDMRCVINDLGECLAKTPEACICKQMPRHVYENAHKKLTDNTE